MTRHPGRHLTPMLLAALMVTSTLVSLQAPPARGAPLSWHACSAADLSTQGFLCARLDVPIALDGSTPGAFSLALTRHESTGTPQERIGSLVFNPGGPGGSGLIAAPYLWSSLSPEVQRRFDLVTWDPRGVGATTPALTSCSVSRFEPPMTGPVDWQSVMSAYRPVVASANADCLARNATLANHVATMDAVHDLDAIRAAIGDGLLTYYGMSYGTRIGYAYALTYPDRVRAILMDGSVDPSGSIAGLADGATAPDEAWRVFVRARPAAARQFETALTGLTRQPLRLSPSLRFTRWDLTETALFSTASEQDYDALATFIRFVRLAQRGPLAKRTAALRVLRQSYTPALSGWTVGLGAFVDCVDYPDRPDATLQSSLLQGAIAVAPLNGPSFQSQLGLLCEGLPASPSPLPTIAHDGPAVSMLLLGAMHDAATPYLWTTRMAQAFPAAGVVTYDSTQHVTWNGTSSCVNEVADAFLITLRLPPSDPRCASTRP